MARSWDYIGPWRITVHIVLWSFTHREDIPSQTNIQATVENPAIHFLVACSSSVEDQAAIVQDRIECLQSPIVTSNGIEVAAVFRWRPPRETV